jgi:SSS family solute:Na+ symporter
MPEFMGKRYGDSTQNILAWYALIKILIFLVSLGVFWRFFGSTNFRRSNGSAVIVWYFGLYLYGWTQSYCKGECFSNDFLIGVSTTLTIFYRKWRYLDMYQQVPADFWTLIHPANDTKYPWPAILLGYPVSLLHFSLIKPWCSQF